MHGPLTRFINYYRMHGLSHTLRRVMELPHRISKGYMILIYAELQEVNDSVLNLPENVTIEGKKNYEDALQPDMQKLIDHWRKANFIDKIQARFESGALLWTIKSNGDIAGYAWSIQETMAAAFPLPITPHDAIIFDAEILDEYRGHGFYGLLMNYIFGQLKKMGTTRVFGILYGWNSSVIHGIEKTHFHKFSEVRKFHLRGRNITIW